MSVLWRKTFRDLWQSKILFSAIVLLLATGIGLFVSMYSAFQDLAASEDFTYEQLNFADVTYRFTESSGEADSVALQVPGVIAAEGRSVREVAIRQPNNPNSFIPARVVTLPEKGRPLVNDLFVERGSYVADGAGDAVMVDDHFASHYGLRPGDSVELALEGRSHQFTIAGTFISPEYIWKARSNQEPFVGKGDFAVIMARGSTVSSLFGGSPAQNEVVVKIEPDANLDSTIARITEEVSPFGVETVTPRDEQISFLLLKLDLDGFAELAVVVPGLFLIVTALVVYVLLNRTVQSQRQTVGVMRAVGFSRLQVVRHYLSFTILIAIAGTVIGIVFGLFVGRYITDLYTAGVGIPFTVSEAHPWTLVVSGALGISVSLLGGIIPAAIAASSSPSTTMRQREPRVKSVVSLERFTGVNRAPYMLRLGIRNSLRSLGRTSSSVLGIAVAVGLVVASLGMLDSMNHAFGVQFDEIQRYDLKLTLATATEPETLSEFGSRADIARIEPVVEIPVAVTTADASQNSLLVGLADDTRLMKLPHVSGARPLSTRGLFVSQGMADSLGADVGDVVQTQLLGHTYDVAIDGLIAEPLSGGIYMRLSAVNDLTGQQLATGALVAISEGADKTSVLEGLNQDPRILVVEDPDRVRSGFQDLMSLFYQFVGIFIAFGIALGAIAVFNTVTINVLDRRRELATMRALGFSRVSVDSLLTFENLIVGSLGVLIGLAIGYALTVELMSLFEAEAFVIGAYITPLTYGAVGISALFLVLLSQAPGLRGLHHVDLAVATKGLAS